MFLTPLPIEVFLSRVLAASEDCGYLGVVLLLARTADARSQHSELTEDWASVHDVTGPMLAVVCPAPSPGTPTRGLGGVSHPTRELLGGVEGLRLNLSDSADSRSFGRSFWQPGDGTCDLGWPAALKPLSDEEHQASWTQATTNAAAFFGVDESSIPCILVLSLLERHGVLIEVTERLSIYGLFKRVIENVGPEPCRLEQLLQEQRLTDYRYEQLLAHKFEWEYVSRRVSKEWPQQVDALDRCLAQIEHLDLALISECRRRLGALRHDGSSDAFLSERLHELVELIPAGPEAVPAEVPKGAAKRIRRMIDKLEHGHPGIGFLPALPVPPDLDRIPELASRLSQLYWEIKVAKQTVAQTVNLAAAAIKAGQELLNPAETSPLRAAHALPGWALTQVRRSRAKPPQTRWARA